MNASTAARAWSSEDLLSDLNERFLLLSNGSFRCPWNTNIEKVVSISIPNNLGITIILTVEKLKTKSAHFQYGITFIVQTYWGVFNTNT